MTDEDARQIAQDFLDHQGDVTLHGNVDATLDCCDIPCTMESIEGRVVATNRAEMRAICVSFINKLKIKRVTHLVRNCLEARFKDQDTIWASYKTRFVGDGNMMQEDPYVGYVVLKRRADGWKISTMQFLASSNSPANETLKHWVPIDAASDDTA